MISIEHGNKWLFFWMCLLQNATTVFVRDFIFKKTLFEKLQYLKHQQ